MITKATVLRTDHLLHQLPVLRTQWWEIDFWGHRRLLASVLTRKVSSAKLRPQLTRLLSICSRSERVSLQTSQSENP